mgnify:CR=1 FL=1
MQGGRQQNINLVSGSKNIKKSVHAQEYDYSKKIYEITEQEKEKHKELLDFINNF